MAQKFLYFFLSHLFTAAKNTAYRNGLHDLKCLYTHHHRAFIQFEDKKKARKAQTQRQKKSKIN
jgi:hypothetical protein